MPNAGIQGTRSTSWKSACVASNDHQMASVTANATRDSPSAIALTAPSRRPSALGMSSRRMAAASGTTQESVSSIENPKADLKVGLYAVQGPASGPPYRQSFVEADLQVGQAPRSSSPQVIPQHDDDADEQRAGVGAHRSGLQAPQPGGAGGDDGRGPVDGTVDDAHVEAAPQALTGHD